jgi:hypothetical protein
MNWKDPVLMKRLRVCWFLSTGVLTIMAAYFMFWNMVLPYPIHSREYSDELVSRLLHEGRNPYSIEVNPTNLYVYGFVYHLVVYPFASLFGDTLPTHRAVADAALILCCVVLYWGMRLTLVPWSIAIAGVLLFFGQIGYNDIIAEGNSLGLLFMLLALVLPLAAGFRPASLLANLVLALLALYTKPYYVLCAPALMLYLFLFRSKGAGLICGIAFTIALAVTLWAVNVIFPLYFTNVFYLNYNFSKLSMSFRHLLHVLILYFPLGIAFALLLAWQAQRFFTGPGSWTTIRWQFHLMDLRQPLVLAPQISWIDYLLTTYLIIYLFSLGPHGGNLLTYVYELITPLLIWRCCIIAGVEAPERIEPLLAFQVTVLAVLGFLAFPMLVRHQVDHRSEWTHAADVAARYQTMLAPGCMDGILIAQDKAIYDGGCTDLDSLCFPNNPWPIAIPFREKCREFSASLQEEVEHQKFDAVFLYASSPIFPLVPREVVERYYHKIESFPVGMAFENYEMEVWVPGTSSTSSTRG